ncbi:AAA family ATPase [Paenibacillus eucommiae]|uniref:Stage V sporulation protein K n=1 Tax=Paenibacillus eucommiae TaxID=1355755 RepID=A0ABS4J811_9BACL|nr:AAA family ATPase [Paenibacillus eucommiae]MBP1995201.1 stage V sporulation protein K [Paenibacillus eucommiae]
MSGRVITKEQKTNTIPSRQINIVLRNAEVQPAMEAEAQINSSKRTPMEGPLSDIFKELNQMVGLDHVKELVHEIYALIQVSQFRIEAGLLSNSHVYHMIFRGNPGTGKTTVARLLGRMFHAMGVLSKGHFIEVERADLVGEYIGHTALKTRDLMKKAMGGILFIDEAYSLARGGDKDFGKEAIDCLVKGMEDKKNDFILILAGYPEEMELFLSTNPGLPSRFPIQVDFEDYHIDHLIQISELMVKEREYVLLPQAIVKLRQHLNEEKSASWRTFSNARYVRNLLEKSIRHQAVRLLNQYTTVPSKQELMSIRPEDLKIKTK